MGLNLPVVVVNRKTGRVTPTYVGLNPLFIVVKFLLACGNAHVCGFESAEGPRAKVLKNE